MSDMWLSRSATRSHVSQTIPVLLLAILASIFSTTDVTSSVLASSSDRRSREVHPPAHLPPLPPQHLKLNLGPGGTPNPIIRLEIIAILPDPSNESLALSKALSRALNSITGPSAPTPPHLPPEGIDLSGGKERPVNWRIKNFFITNHSSSSPPGSSRGKPSALLPPSPSSTDHNLYYNNDDHHHFHQDMAGAPGEEEAHDDFRYRAPKPATFSLYSTNRTQQQQIQSQSPQSPTISSSSVPLPPYRPGLGWGYKLGESGNGSVGGMPLGSQSQPAGVKTKPLFTPETIQPFCDFLSRSRAVTIVNFIGDVGSERLISLVSASAAIPLIGSAQYLNPLQNHHKKKDDFYVNLSTSVRHFARALGHMLVYCHWHSFAVFLDDSPSVQNTQIIWDEELSRMKVTTGPSPAFVDDDYEEHLGSRLSNDVFDDDMDEDDGENDPVLHPTFISLRTKYPNSAFRALSEVTKATQGVIVLLCSRQTLDNVFRAAHQLRMLNGDYVFILVGQYSQFEEIPDWIPSGVLALRSPRSAQVGKHTMKTTGKLLASAFLAIKNHPVPPDVFHESPLPTPPRPLPTFPSHSVHAEVKGKSVIQSPPFPQDILRRTGEASKFKRSLQHRLLASSPLTSASSSSSETTVEDQEDMSGGLELHQDVEEEDKGNDHPLSGIRSNNLGLNSQYFHSSPPGDNRGRKRGKLREEFLEKQKQNRIVTPPGSGGFADIYSGIISTDKTRTILQNLDDPTKLGGAKRSDGERFLKNPEKSVWKSKRDLLQAPQLTHTSATVIESDGGRSFIIDDLLDSDFQPDIIPTPTHASRRSHIPQEHNTDSTGTLLDVFANPPNASCWTQYPSPLRKFASVSLIRELRHQMEKLANSSAITNLPFEILNLVRNGSNQREWKKVGNSSVDSSEVHLETIRWPGGGIFGPVERPSKAYRVITIVAPPFVMEAEAEDNRTCVKGLPCLKVNTNSKDDLALIFADYERGKQGSYELACCDGLAMDLLSSIGRELKFEIDLYLVPDGYFGARTVMTGDWNGIMSALISGGAHMSFAPLSVTSARSTIVDFSTPYFFTGVGLLGVSKHRDVPLLAFLAPFSPKLWLAIFLALNMTALVVALYEWFSPFGLNPWGRQRTKNFSMASALWVVWGRLFSHLVAFKAPKSWPNKFLINVWGGFSVIFVASYTANIAALFAGMFFERAVDVHDRSLLSQRVAAVKHSATDFYIKRENALLWEHIQRFPVHSFQQGVDMLKNGTLDLLIGDRPLLDYYRGTDPTCSLIDISEHDKIGDDTYAVAMTRGFPLRDSISALIAKYIANGYMDYLQGKWYGQFACFRAQAQTQRARALGVDAVAGMFIMLGVGMAVGLLILILELIVYKYALPYFRSQPKGTLWRSPNLMFFSQKLYRFINCVELVSPHHAAKELMSTLRSGQITSLFQKSVKRKEHEQRRRRKSKAQFFEMIQEIRRVQHQERQKRATTSRKASKDTILASSGSEPPPIYSIQDRLQTNKQTPKVIRILGEHVDIDDDYSPPGGSRIGQSVSQEHLSVYSEGQGGSRKTSKSSIFSFGKVKSSGSRGSLSQHSTGSAGEFSAITMTSSKPSKKPLKTILKRGSIASPRRISPDHSRQSSLNAIGKKLASPSSPTPSITRLTKGAAKFKFSTSMSTPSAKALQKKYGSRYQGYTSGTGGGGDAGNRDDSEDESDISAAEKAEILTVDLTALSKNEVIDLWKTSESDLKTKLAIALKNQEELNEKVLALQQQQQTAIKAHQTAAAEEPAKAGRSRSRSSNSSRYGHSSREDITDPENPFLRHEEFQPP